MDYYKTLGVEKNATPEEIKKAYRKLAGANHPDRGGDTATFQKIQQAYDVLSDPQKKQEYDNPMHQQNMHGFAGNPFMNQGVFDINEIFGQMFGHRNPFGFNQQRQSHQVFRTTVNISLNDVYNGSKQVLKMQTPQGTKVINIDIPKGLQDNSQLRYDNVLEGAVLIIDFKILPDLKYERKGNDLYCNHSVSVLDLIVGTNFKFSTISGAMLDVSVPPKTQPFMQLKLGGQGMPIQGTNNYGDQIIVLKPFVPDNIHYNIIDSIKNFKNS